MNSTVNMLATEDIARILNPYRVTLDDAMLAQVQAYVGLLIAWNKRISLTTVIDPHEVMKFHFGESLFAASVIPIQVGRLADVGAGAGFPGIPLKILNPCIDLKLIESNAKKCAFLSEAVRKLGLSDVEVVHSRMESVPSDLGPFDFVAARAVGNHAGILSWAKQRLSPLGKVVLWIGGEDANKLSSERGWNWHSPVMIPGSRQRYILVGSPER